jgi:hypothetical protein
MTFPHHFLQNFLWNYETVKLWNYETVKLRNCETAKRVTQTPIDEIIDRIFHQNIEATKGMLCNAVESMDWISNFKFQVTSMLRRFRPEKTELERDWFQDAHAREDMLASFCIDQNNLNGILIYLLKSPFQQDIYADQNNFKSKNTQQNSWQKQVWAGLSRFEQVRSEQFWKRYLKCSNLYAIRRQRSTE